MTFNIFKRKKVSIKNHILLIFMACSFLSVSACQNIEKYKENYNIRRAIPKQGIYYYNSNDNTDYLQAISFSIEKDTESTSTQNNLITSDGTSYKVSFYIQFNNDEQLNKSDIGTIKCQTIRANVVEWNSSNSGFSIHFYYENPIAFKETCFSSFIYRAYKPDFYKTQHLPLLYKEF